jgi:hypothetical protein
MDEPILLPDVDSAAPPVDHPDEVTDEEAEAGHVEYLAVDDLDDESSGDAGADQ